jgi:hypothetical protein
VRLPSTRSNLVLPDALRSNGSSPRAASSSKKRAVGSVAVWVMASP